MWNSSISLTPKDNLLCLIKFGGKGCQQCSLDTSVEVYKFTIKKTKHFVLAKELMLVVCLPDTCNMLKVIICQNSNI